jgi:hypothetical protein
VATERSSSSDRPSRARSAPKASAKKASAKKASAKKSTSSSGSRISATTVGAAAARQLAELAGRDVEGVTSLAKNDDGWQVEVEVVESHRIPDTTDLMALYEVQVDTDGDLTSYRRLRRYSRGQAGAEQGM